MRHELITTIKPIMTPAELEADKPKFNANDKAAKQLFADVQKAYDNLILTQIEAAPVMGIAPDYAKKAYEEAGTHYTDLVTIAAEATYGMAPGFWTDPKTFDDLEMSGIPVRGRTYNEMAFIAGE